MRGTVGALLASVFVLGTLVYAAGLEARDPDVYYRALQEDGTLEWATFWAFLLAAVANLRAARAFRREGGPWPWFGVGLALFCFLVAMEEISWGQRVLGFRAPQYFLENNYQQELNFHNVVDTGLRKLLFQAILLGYGVALPLLGAIPPLGRRLRAIGVVWPSALLIPAFAISWATYALYPWPFTGEVVELMMGFGFLMEALLRGPATGVAPWLRVAVAGAAALGLGFVSDLASRERTSADPSALEAARVELEALRRDLHTQDRVRARGGRARPSVRCGLHKRLYTFVVEKDGHFFRTGEFVDLVEQGLPEVRADYLIDPWGSAYWIRFECSEDGRRRSLFLYSFGPNRNRDSSEWELLGDDVGVYVHRAGGPEEEERLRQRVGPGAMSKEDPAELP